MADSIDSILQELDAGYNPARQAINDRLAQLQPQADAAISGLKQQQSNAFQDITNGARDRGMGFSGIPIEEQAKYTGGTFLPAVANVQKSVQDGRNSLIDALNSTNLDQRKTAYGIRDSQLTREQAAADAAATRAASASAANAGTAGLASLFGGGTTPQAAGPQADPAIAMKQSAQKDVMSVLGNHNIDQLTNYWRAISKSAGYGNQTDQLKVQALQSIAPGLFKGGQLNTSYLAKAKQQGIRIF